MYSKYLSNEMKVCMYPSNLRYYHAILKHSRCKQQAERLKKKSNDLFSCCRAAVGINFSIVAILTFKWWWKNHISAMLLFQSNWVELPLLENC